MSEQAKSIGAGSKYAYISSLYFVAVGVLYLWGYWPTFNVNILEYAGLTDVIKTAAYPIASLFVFFVLDAVMGELLACGDLLPPGGGVNTATGRFLHKFAPLLIVVYLSTTLLLFLFGPDEKWRILPVLVGLPLYLLGLRFEILSDLVPHKNIRSIFVFVLSVLPFFAYGHGKLRALGVLSGEEYSFTPSQVGSVPAGVEPIEKRPRYLGVAGGNVFFYIPEHRSTIVVAISELKVLELRKQVRSSPSREPKRTATEK